MSVSGVAGWFNLKGLEIAVALPDEIYSGSGTVVTVTVENRKRMVPTFLLRLGLLGGTGRLLHLDGGGNETIPLVVSLEGRGGKLLGGVEISSPFPVNFFVRSRVIAFEGGFTVLAAPLPGSSAEDGGLREASGEWSSGRGEEGDFHSIAPYTGSEPKKAIHWRLSARQQDMLVKQFSAATATPVVVDLAALPGRNLDERVGRGTFLVNRLMKAGKPVGLRLGDRFFPPATGRRHRLHLLHELAVHGLG